MAHVASCSLSEQQQASFKATTSAGKRLRQANSLTQLCFPVIQSHRDFSINLTISIKELPRVLVRLLLQSKTSGVHVCSR